MADDRWFISTQSETDARAAGLLPLKGSEDRRDLLPQPPLSPSEQRSEYGPDPAIDWTLEIALPSPTKQRPITKACAPQRDCELYGRADGRWTYVVAGDAPERFDRLKWSMRLLYRNDGEWLARTALELAKFQAMARRSAEALKGNLLEAAVSPGDGAKRATELHALVGSIEETFEVEVAGHFEGRDVWDAMMCLGLRWGDGDLFHWENPVEVGHDRHFSVWTRTPPGYFLPEEIAAGKTFDDVIFCFSVPRCAAPLQVANALVNAAHWTAERLGGRCEEPDLLAVQKSADRMLQFGIAPGSGTALLLF